MGSKTFKRSESAPQNAHQADEGAVLQPREDGDGDEGCPGQISLPKEVLDSEYFVLRLKLTVM